MTPRIYAPLGSALVPWHPAGDQPAIRIGIVTDDQGLRSEHDALIRHAPPSLKPREYRISAAGRCSDHRPVLQQLRARLHDDDVDAIQLASPRLAAVWMRWLSVRLGLPLISTHDGVPGGEASSSVRGIARRHYETWLYGRCARVVISSEPRVGPCCVTGGPASAWSLQQPGLIPRPSHRPGARRP